MATYDHLLVSEEGDGVLLVRFNRPEVMNAVNTAMGSELLDVFTRINQGGLPSARVVVLTGAGERAFCAGGDLKERNGMTVEQWAAQRVIFKQYNLAMERCPIPVICAVNGAALGGGAEMVLRSDFSYAADHATFGFPEIKRGFIPGSGGTQRFPRLVGAARGLEVLLTGATFTARSAMEWGMVNEVTTREELLPRTFVVANTIASYSADAVRTLKSCIRQGLQTDIETGLVLEAFAQQRLVASPDRLEGIAAFVEKREPKWQDKK